MSGLGEAADALAHFELLRGLTSGGSEDFLLRFGAVADLVHADHTLWPLDALERRFNWMEQDRVQGVIRSLRRSGWLESVGVAGYRLSSDGLAVYATLARLSLLRTGREDDLAMGVFDLEASTRLDEDKGPALRHLQHHLRRSIEDVEAAVDSRSEIKVMEAREKLDKNLQWSRRARMLLDEVDVEEDESYRSGQRLGQDLSELHRWHSVMQRVLDDLGSSRVQIGALGIRPADISRYLMGLSLDELIGLGGAHLSEPVWPFVCLLDNVIDVTEFALLVAEQRDTRQVGWREGDPADPEIGEAQDTHGAAAFRAFHERLETVLGAAEPTTLPDMLLAGDYARTCYRMTLLSLEDEDEDARIALDVMKTTRGGKLRVEKPTVDYVTEMSMGSVRAARRKAS